MKFVSLLSVIILFFIFGCAVNSSTGLITVENRTTTTLTSVTVGQTIIELMILPGQKADYYYNTLSGQLYTLGVPVSNSYYFDLNANSSKDTGEGMGEVHFSFKPNYWVKIFAFTTNSGNFINVSVAKQDGSLSSYKEYIDY
jgi:hypothetical protein